MSEVPLPIRWRHALRVSDQTDDAGEVIRSGSGLTATQHHVALTLSVFMDGQGRARVSHFTLAENCGRKRHTVRRALGELVELGYLEEQRPEKFHRGTKIVYRAVIPSGKGSPRVPEGVPSGTPSTDGKGSPRVTEGVPSGNGRGTAEYPQEQEEQEEQQQRTEIPESDLRRIAYEEAKTRAHTNPDALAAKILREDRDRLTEKALEQRRKQDSHQAVIDCPRCDDDGLAYFTADGVQTTRDDPQQRIVEYCTHDGPQPLNEDRAIWDPASEKEGQT